MISYIDKQRYPINSVAALLTIYDLLLLNMNLYLSYKRRFRVNKIKFKFRETFHAYKKKMGDQMKKLII